ncbi:MAG: hypothetical protein AAF721_40190 [Myxococcota bacterium]
MKVLGWASSLFLLAALAACDGESGRAGTMGGAEGGPKADNTNESDGADGALTAEMIDLLDQAGAHLGSPTPHTSDDGGDANDGHDDSPKPQFTCKDRCGKYVDEHAEGCSCDEACWDEGNCCEDYRDLCQADGDESDGGDPPLPDEASCDGRCGLASFDDSCWCDIGCTQNDDCCHDYAAQCVGHAPQPEPEDVDDVAAPVTPMANGTACLKFIDDDNNIDKIVDAAGHPDAAEDNPCLAAALVIWTPSGGTFTPTSAVVCLGEAANDGTLAAAKSYLKQNRDDLKVCANNTAGEITTAVRAAADKIAIFEVD